MAGRNQHYIPQFFLKGFAVKRGKKHNVYVYRQDKIFNPPTDGIATQRDFYSKPDDEGVILDDVITDYEREILLPIYRRLEQSKVSDIVESSDVAELLTHLCIRQAQIRKNFSIISQNLMSDLLKKFKDKRWVSRKFDAALKQEKEKFPNSLQNIDGFLQHNLQILKSKPIENLFQAEILKHYEKLFVSQIDEHIKKGHQEALHQELAPEIRVDGLKKLRWEIKGRPSDHEGFILPDCVAVSLYKGKVKPLFYANIGQYGNVIFPIDAERIIFGSNEHFHDVPYKKINKLMAECSSDFFIAQEQNSKFELLKPIIGTQMKQLSNSLIREALRDI